MVNSSLVLKTLPHVEHVNCLVLGLSSGGGAGGCPGGGSGGFGGGAIIVSFTGSTGFLG